MKRLFAIISITTLCCVMLGGCSFFRRQPQPATQNSVNTEETTISETTEDNTGTSQKPTTTDEFPTENDDNNNYTEPLERWSVSVPDVWDEYGEILEGPNGEYVRFVYKKAYDEYDAGHVFTIYTTTAKNKVDVTTFPHAEEIYLDKNIQIYVDYPTDVQFGGIYGDDMEAQGKEYTRLSETVESIVDSLKVF